MTEARARALLTRLGTFLDQFTTCFSRRAHRTYASRYLQGLLNDSCRKSMQPMHGRLSDPGSYQGLQHFITHSTWEARPFWRRLREMIPVRSGILAIDDTGLPKQGTASVGVQRQYCGALGKIANCQVAVSTALIAGKLAWLMGSIRAYPGSSSILISGALACRKQLSIRSSYGDSRRILRSSTKSWKSDLPRCERSYIRWELRGGIRSTRSSLKISRST